MISRNLHWPPYEGDGLNITERYKVQPLSMNAWAPALVTYLSYSQRLRETGEKTVCAAVKESYHLSDEQWIERQGTQHHVED
jgi:hypothetical protein